MIYTCHYPSPLGGMTMTGEGETLTGLWFDGQKGQNRIISAEYPERDLPVFDQTCRWLDVYFSGEAPDFTPALTLKSTAFRKAVWELLLTIPYGRTMTYGQIADRIAVQTGIQRMSAQAVGGAVGHNPIALIIPCHRVIGAGGNLTGYAAGMDKKTALLQMEGADMSTLYIPKGRTGYE